MSDDDPGPEDALDDVDLPQPNREELVNFISEFMASSMNVGQVYRSHLVETVAARVYDEFGSDGLCDLMLKIDEQANWISDIVIDTPDLDEVMFKRHGTFDMDLVAKARQTEGLLELNRKIWRLRKKYALMIVDEIFEKENDPTPKPISDLLPDPDNIS